MGFYEYTTYICIKLSRLNKQQIVNQYQTSANVSQIITQLQQEQNHFQISNLVGSSLSFIISETFKKANKPYLLIFNDKEEAAYYLNDLEQLLGDKNVLFFQVHTEDLIKLKKQTMQMFYCVLKF